jgi:hypothetical protein
MEATQRLMLAHGASVCILIDAALSPELDTFIAESTELAVRGFQSRHWAVRYAAFSVDLHGEIALPLP